MKAKIILIMSCLILISLVFADPPSSENFTLVQRGFLTGNANQAIPPGSANFELKECAVFGISNDGIFSTGYIYYPGFVQPTNYAPTILLPDSFTFDEDDGLIVDFAPFINDINRDIVTLSVSGNIEVMVDISDFTVTFSSTENWNGTEILTFTANDNMDRAIASDIVDIIVTPVNDNPTIVLSDDFTFDEDDELIVDFTAYVDDVDMDDLTLTVTGNTQVSIEIMALEVTFGAAENWNGTETLTFIIDDNQNDRVSFTIGNKTLEKNSASSRATAEDDVEVIVTPVNDEPVLIGFIPEELEFTVEEDSIVTFSVEVEDIDSTIEYEWYVDDVLQAENIEEFVYIFEIVGDIEIKSVASDEDYTIETIWTVEVEPGSAVGDIIPVSTELNQNYPNPFNPITTISYSLLDAGRVRIEIFNIKGEKIQTIVNEYKNIGHHSTVWNGKDNSGKSVASGMYFYNMVTEDYHKIRKMLLIK